MAYHSEACYSYRTHNGYSYRINEGYIRVPDIIQPPRPIVFTHNNLTSLPYHYNYNYNYSGSSGPITLNWKECCTSKGWCIDSEKFSDDKIFRNYLIAINILSLLLFFQIGILTLFLTLKYKNCDVSNRDKLATSIGCLMFLCIPCLIGTCISSIILHKYLE